MEDCLLDPTPLPARTRMARASLLVILGVALLLALSGLVAANTARASGPDAVEQRRFMWAMAGQESGGDYYARNASSGAYGRYQIMPFNWPVWAAEFIGDGQADQTPFNQERVAFAKIRNLYLWLGSWKRVAYWWLTGSSEPDQKKWSDYASGYVDNIMSLRRRAPTKGVTTPRRTSPYAGKGDWRLSGSKQRLFVKAAGRKWARRGVVDDGQVLKVRRAVATARGVRWLQVLTVDGRLGWLKQQRTVPARRPASATRFQRVADRGGSTVHQDRRNVRPRPR